MAVAASPEIVPASRDRWQDVVELLGVSGAFVGIASMFDAAGFRRVVVTDAHSGNLPRLLVRLDLP